MIGRGGKDIPIGRAMDHVGGYAVGNDVSARDWQLGKPGKQWMAGKTFDTFAPIGPVVVTPDEVPDPHNLPIRLKLNGRTMQDSNTDQLIFRVDYVVAYLSRIFTLQPGDLIFTGTPPGVGMARKPPVWLEDGDVGRGEHRRAGDADQPGRPPLIRPGRPGRPGGGSRVGGKIRRLEVYSRADPGLLSRRFASAPHANRTVRGVRPRPARPRWRRRKVRHAP